MQDLRREILRIEYKKEKQKDLLTTLPTLLKQHPLQEKRKPIGEINIIDLKKIGLYRSITTEGKRRRTPDILTAESRDTS